MAIRIGDVDFGIDANTKGLQRAIAQLQKFQLQVDSVAASQVKGSAAAAAAMSKQESAVKRALQQTLNLQQALRKSGAPAKDIARVQTAFRQLTTSMTEAQLTTVGFTRAQDAFSTKLGRSRRALKDLQDVARGKGISRLTEAMRDLESSAVLAVGPLSGIGARIRSLSAIVTRSSVAIAALLGSITAVTVGLFAMAKAALNANIVFEQATARFTAASGSLSTAKDQMKFVIQVSRSMGLRIQDTARGFSRLTAAAAGTALEGAGIRKVFVGIASAAAALRLEAGEVQGVFRAIEQMMSKGTVQAEELRGQLGERLPGAFRLAATAMGVNTIQLGRMLKAGEVLAEVMLPKLAKVLTDTFGDAARDNINSYQGSLNNLGNAAIQFSADFDEVVGISDLVVSAFQLLTRVLDSFRDNLVLTIQWIAAAASAMLALAAPVIIGGIITLAKAIATAALAMNLLNLAIFANPIGGLVVLMAKLTLAISGAVAGFFGFKFLMRDIAAELESLKESVEELDDIVATADKITKAFDSTRTEISKLIERTLVLEQVLKRAGKAQVSPRVLLAGAEALSVMLKGTMGDVKAFAKFLSEKLGREIPATMSSVAAAVARIRLEAKDAEKAIKDLFDAFASTKAQDSIDKLDQKVDSLRKRFEAMSRGPGALEFFDKVTTKVQAVRQAMEEAGEGFLTADQLASLAAFEAILTEITGVQGNVARATEKANQTIADMTLRLAILKTRNEGVIEAFDGISVAAENFRRRLIATQGDTEETNKLFEIMRQLLVEIAAAEAQRGFDKATDRATQAVAKLRAELDAMKRGAEDLEVFQNITRAFDRMAEALKGSDPDQAAKILADYKDVLEDVLATQKKLAVASDFSRAITRGFEDMILSAKGAKEAIADLISELARLILRAVLLAPLGNAITSALGGLFTGGTGTAAAVPKAAHGLSAIVKGPGGTDSQLISFFATPGETLEVRPPGRSGGGGGDINITIHAPGADQGTFARMREIIETEMVPQILRTASQNTINRLRKPRFS